MEEDEKLGFSPCGVGPLFLGPPGLDCSFLFRTAGEGCASLRLRFSSAALLDMFISLSHGRKRNRTKEKGRRLNSRG
jgi:hypothetical protein